MPFTTYKGYSVPTTGTLPGTWGTELNVNSLGVIDLNLGGIVTKSLSNVNITLSAIESQNLIVRLIGTLTGAVTVITAAQGLTIVQNACTGAFNVRFSNGIGTPVIVAQGLSTMVQLDAVNGPFLTGGRASTVGQIAFFAGVAVPGGWLEADGSLISRADYAALWAYAQSSGNIQTDANWTSQLMYGAFSTGDGTTTFRIPDLRGQFLRPWSHTSPGNDTGRIAGQYQAAGVLNHVHPAASVVTDTGHRHDTNTQNALGAYGLVSGGGYFDTIQTSQFSGHLTALGMTGITVATTVSNNTSGLASDNRPPNIAELCCISYL